MAKRKLPCPTVLRLLLRYEPETGRLFWRRRSIVWFEDAPHCGTWNTRFAGRECFISTSAYGYKRGAVLLSQLQAHRVIWALVHGEWPAADVDHINGNRTDNRLGNLRHATRAQNLRNSGSRGGSSRYCGVCWDRARGKWVANCYDDTGRNRHLGRYDDESRAALAYDEAARRWHGAYARLNFP